jgi:hypothetical protein
MHLNWNNAKQKFQYLIAQNGEWLQWLQRSVDTSSAYDTSSAITYGYGDSQTIWTTGSFKALVQHISATDIVIPAGFYEDDFERVYVNPDVNLAQWDQCIIPSGSGIRYLILSRHVWRLNGDVIVSKYAIVRRLVPRSGSAY